jgi:hypothetical protein
MLAAAATVWRHSKRGLSWFSARENLACALPITVGIALAAYLMDEAFIVLVGATFGVVLPKTARIRNALAVGFTSLLIFYLLSKIKLEFVGQPMFLFDLHYLKDNLFILAANDWMFLFGLVIFSLIFITVFFIYIIKPSQRWTQKRIASLLIILLLCLSTGVFIARKNVDLWRIDRGLPSFAVFLDSARVTGYRFVPPAKAHVVANKSEPKPADIEPKSNPLPHLVFVLQESTISPSQLTLSKPYKPKRLFVNSSHSKAGLLTVNTFGGGTWLSVFSFLNQFRPDQLGQNKLYVTFQLTGRLNRTLFSVLKSKGYATSVIYSVPGSFINAERFLLSNGLDRFDDPASAGIGTGWDWRTPDSAFLEVALERLKSDRPQAILVLTIAQHEPHDSTNPIADYVSRFAASDKAHGDFVDGAFDASRRPIVIVTFGDHQPKFMSGIEAAPPRYETSYQVECHPAVTCDFSKVPSHVDLTLLATHVFEAAGLQIDELMQVQKELYANCVADILQCHKDAMAAFNWYLSQKVLR